MKSVNLSSDIRLLSNPLADVGECRNTRDIAPNIFVLFNIDFSRQKRDELETNLREDPSVWETGWISE